MSYTEIYGLTNDSVVCIGETKNSWRGAVAVWTMLEKKYLLLITFAISISLETYDFFLFQIVSKIAFQIHNTLAFLIGA